MSTDPSGSLAMHPEDITASVPLEGVSGGSVAGVKPPVPALAAGRSPRLRSLDALRGFDMFWIIGGGALIEAIAGYWSTPGLKAVTSQLEHVKWHGFQFEDLIFPLFLFISGVTMPFALVSRLERGEGKGGLYWRIARRVVLLVFLGMVVNGLFKCDFAHQRYCSVLGRIGLAYGLAAVIVINAGVRVQLLSFVGLLVAYWAALRYIPVPGVGAGQWDDQSTCLAGYVDRLLVPGALYRGDHDPEGLLSTVPAVSTALLGAMAGRWLRGAWPGGVVKALGLLAAGLVSLLLGLVIGGGDLPGLTEFWGGLFSGLPESWRQAMAGLPEFCRQWKPLFPINKNLWSSSFVLYAGGWSLLLLGLFYLVIDVIGLWRWSFVFIVIGLNPITIYVGQRFIDFRAAADFFFQGAVHRWAAEAAWPVLMQAGEFLLVWLFLYFLYRKKVFLKV
ncbi:MAG: DUF5009 domain-containing protein [Phycisphaerae bacterium]|nr:DUF5009 domain-containing protein [Phycisphaerae bacterium]